MSTLERVNYYTESSVAAKFVEYKRQNPGLFSNRVILSFFDDEQNQMLLLESLDGESEKEEKLNEAFRKYFFQFRFVNYVTSSLRFMSIDQMRRNQRYAARNVLIYDRPSSEDSDMSIGETITAYCTLGGEMSLRKGDEPFQASFEDEQIETAFQSLTDRQKHVTMLYYGHDLHDHEIAKCLQVSQQAVGKTRNTALKKMRTALGKHR